MKYVKEFAAGNPSVTDLRFYTRLGVDKFHYRVVRDAEGKITTMAEVLENGMWLGVCFRRGGPDLACRDGTYLVLGRSSPRSYYPL